MNLRQGGPDRPEVVGVEEFVGKDVIDEPRVRFDDAADDPPHLRLVEALGQRIDRQNAAAGRVFVVGQELDPRMDHLPAHPFQLRLAARPGSAGLRTSFCRIQG